MRLKFIEIHFYFTLIVYRIMKVNMIGVTIFKMLIIKIDYHNSQAIIIWIPGNVDR